MNGDMPQVMPDPDLGAARKYTVKGRRIGSLKSFSAIPRKGDIGEQFQTDF